MSLKITLQKNPLDQSSWMVKSPPAQWTVENGSELKLNGQSIIDLPNVINLPTPPKKNLNDYINGLSEVAADVMCTTITPDNIIKQLQTRIKQKQQNDRFLVSSIEKKALSSSHFLFSESTSNRVGASD